MSENVCRACRFYEPADEATGECRLNPPAVVPATDDGAATSRFPIVCATEWCGAWQPAVFGIGPPAAAAPAEPGGS